MSKKWFFKVYTSHSRKGIHAFSAQTNAYDNKQAKKKIKKWLKQQWLKDPRRIPKNPRIKKDHWKHYEHGMMAGLTIPARKWWTI